ncbi:MAG: hypothetical protein H7836_09195 [Magnetococcus sp. YQC-3]
MAYQHFPKNFDPSQEGGMSPRGGEQGKKDRSRENLVNVVRHLARGNMSLQYGWFQTEEERDSLRKKLANYDFRVHAGCEHQG